MNLSKIDRLIKERPSISLQANEDGQEGPASYEELILMAREIKPLSKKKGVTPLKVIGATAKSTEIVLEEIMINRAQIKACSIKADIKDPLSLLIEDRYTRIPLL